MKCVVFAAMLTCLASNSAAARDGCTLSLSPGHVAFGSSTRGALLAQTAPGETDSSFGSRTVQLRIQCPEPQPMRWQFIAPAADSQRYRWGAGTLQLKIVAARLDGAAVQWAADNGEPLATDLLRPGDRMVPWRAGAIASGAQLEIELEVEARVSDGASRVIDLTRFEGGGRFQLD
ncbi:hypothetical protein BK666_29565 [Pseudomonas frederiksbergensis]|uniref:Uncharacterized protein n=2 Tax=Pseudomonas frederiksbergensis TaxID=104087 RepID=A0A423JMM3_9PSED|nr:hypothetical protein BK666_29565 [Pseudomonas frederiksbergensis]